MSAYQRNVIFYVDDDLDDLDLFQDVIEQLGTHATLFNMGAEMLKALINPSPDATIIFLDLNMPIKSGFEVLKEIKTAPKLKDIPVVVLSTANNAESVKRCKKLGANYFV